jgi:hypothetical protein
LAGGLFTAWRTSKPSKPKGCIASKRLGAADGPCTERRAA